MVLITLNQWPKHQKIFGMEVPVDPMKTCRLILRQRKTDLVSREEKRGRACWSAKKKKRALGVSFSSAKKKKRALDAQHYQRVNRHVP